MTKPRLTIIAGPNGSGKSTLTDEGRLAANGVSLPSSYINADQIAKTLQQSGWVGTQEEREREAFRQARSLRQTYRASGNDFAFETVFSHPSTLIDIQLCQSAGYEVTLVYVTTGNVEINVGRVMGRVSQGGHTVPSATIRDRYDRCLNLLPRAVEEADKALVFDSSTEIATSLCLLKHTVVVPIAPPPYIQSRLVDVLKDRRGERDEISTQHGRVDLPNEAGGTSTGRLVKITPHYAVQQSVSCLVRHDRSLLFGDYVLGQTIAVTYKDGAGSIG